MTTISVKVNVPENLASKRLKIKTNSDGTKRKIVISSNFLSVFGFEKGAKVLEKVLVRERDF
ncbi:hypothetical protein I3271_07505 [Photobacterium leiognathi]|uniref:hypothetical protein n=1 Tax=Photobacterium leiognathi TaxID=553611 RepID=UPI001EDEE9A1|nr:hypothetical protein [Photobacterium leiognathi]MCG3884532.1 hypothetical protein [Photobacterium leiognathi]